MPAGKSKEKDRKIYVDVVIKCGEFETKKTVEQALRDNKVRCGVQWPRDLVSGVNTLRLGYEKATSITIEEKNEQGEKTERVVNLAEHHILIRPCYANNKLKRIFYKIPPRVILKTIGTIMMTRSNPGSRIPKVNIL